MKYVNFTLQKMTPEQLKMNPFKPIMEDFNSLLNYIDEDFTPTGNLCYINESDEKLPTTTLQEFYNIRWFIQHLIDRNRYEHCDHDYFNPLSESKLDLPNKQPFHEVCKFHLTENDS